MRVKILILVTCLQSIMYLNAQDTFSILAFDSITREVGAAGASCVDLFAAPGNLSNDFICELFPDTGAIASQAAYIPQNQINNRYRMRLGDSPTQLISWLQSNDVSSSPTNNFTYRQYGVVNMNAGYPQTAAFTGTSCMNYKNHRIGPNYTIHGNILLGAEVLDSMEAKFNREPGDLACKLMAAMQGAKMIGADTRCAGNGSSSLFAFIKVSQPTDVFGSPSFIQSLKTHANAGIEPIDSLQKLFDSAKSCVINTSGLNPLSSRNEKISVYPNPAGHRLIINTSQANVTSHCTVRDLLGKKIIDTDFTSELILNTSRWDKGLFFVEIKSGTRHLIKKIVVD